MQLAVSSCLLALTAFSAAFALPEAAASDLSTSKPQCGPKVVSLATGIHLNIGGQHAELAAVKKLQKIEAANPREPVRFHKAKGALVADILGGMSIRKYNQAIAPKGNPANAGLAKYAKAQQMELDLAESLTGFSNHDKKVLATLVSDIHAGTMLNKENLGNATENCSLGFTFPA